MTQAEKNTWHGLTRDLITAESGLAQLEASTTAARHSRDACHKRLADFMDSIQPSDAPAPTERKRRSDAGVSRKATLEQVAAKMQANHAPALELLNTAHNAAEDTQR